MAAYAQNPGISRAGLRIKEKTRLLIKAKPTVQTRSVYSLRQNDTSAGAFTVAFRNPWNGIVGGGDLDPSDPNNARTATSSDGGVTWSLTNPPPVTGAIFGLSYVGQRGNGGGNDGRAVVITADTGGAAWTPDEGTTWYTLPGVSGFWSVAFASPKAGWMVGVNGSILKISF